MMPTIRVSDEVDQEIRRRGGFGDTHDSVLRRVLELDKKEAESPTKRAPHGSVTGSATYKPLILKVLLAVKGHSLHAAAVIREVGKSMQGRFTSFDIESTASGAVRWQNRAQWAREELVRDGLLEPVEKAGRGVWKLTPAGIQAAKQG